MITVPDAASIAAMRWCLAVTGRKVGGSTGTAMWGALRLVAEMRADGDDRQRGHPAVRRRASATPTSTTTTAGWPTQGIDIAPYAATLERFYDTGSWSEPPAERPAAVSQGGDQQADEDAGGPEQLGRPGPRQHRDQVAARGAGAAPAGCAGTTGSTNTRPSRASRLVESATATRATAAAPTSRA